MPDSSCYDGTIALFDSDKQCENIYFAYLRRKETIPSFIKSTKVILVHNKKDILKRLSSIEPINGIIVHYLDNPNAEALFALKKLYPEAKVIWCAWGGDFYPAINYPLYDQETQQMLLKKRGRRFTIDFLLKPYKNRFWNWAIPLVDYCSPVLPDEYPYLLQIKGFRAKQILYSYSSAETMDFLTQKVQNIQLGGNVLIGNSATPTNNHLDIFKRIAGEQLPGKLIVPLSYGEPWYKHAVVEKGKLLFGACFCPVFDIMPKEDYYHLISSCGTVIFNHYRQQAMGNSNVMLYLGARVYLSEKSSAYPYYKAMGIHVYSFEKDFAKYKFSKLEAEKVLENREKMNKNIYNKEKLVHILNGVLQVLAK